MTIKYDGDALMPHELRVLFEEAKKRVCELSREADKAFLAMEKLKSDVLVWLSEHQVREGRAE